MKKEQQIKKRIRSDLLRYGIISVVLISACVAIYLYNESLNEENRKVKNRVSKLSSEIIDKNREYDLAEESIESFLKVPASKLPSDTGYSKGYQRIKQVLPKIEKLKNLYSFKKLTFTLGKIEKEKKLSTSEFNAHIGDLSLYYEGISDQYVISFLEDLKDLLPGYLKLKTFVISKKENLTNETARSYITTKSFHFVSGKADFDWITLGKLEDKKAKNKDD